MKSDIRKYILEADDLEIISTNKLLIVHKKQNIILTEISKELMNQCYEIFSGKFIENKKNRSRGLRIIWLDSEIKYLKESYKNKELEGIAKDIKKSKYQINLMLSKLKLLVKREWTKREIEFLKDNINNSNILLAEKLNRSVASIKSKKRVIKLEKNIR